MQYRLSVILLPSVVLFGAWAEADVMAFRRDILIFLLCWLLFLSYRKFINGNRVHIIIMQIVSIITILSHEASIFYMLPIVSVHYFLRLKRSYTWKESFGKTLILCLPSVITFLLCSIYKGNENVANSIWQSWLSMFSQLGAGDVSNGEGVKALQWSAIGAFKFHLRINYLSNIHGIRTIFVWPLILLSMIYLLVNVNRVKILASKARRPFSVIKYIHLLIVVSLFMTPMFTILSCDFRRVISYCIFTAFLFYFSVGSKELNVFYIPKWSYRLKYFCSLLSRGLFAKKWVFLLIFLFLGCPFAGFNTVEYIYSSLIGSVYYIAKNIMEHIALIY